MVIDHACSDIQLPKDIIDKLLQEFCIQNNIQDENALQLYIKRQGITVEDLAHHLSLSRKVEILSLQEFSNKAESHFLKRKEQLDQVTYSLLRVEDSGLSHELYLRIEAKEGSFAELARIHSKGPEKATNGIVGPASLSKAHPQLSQRLQTAPIGVVLEPFRIEDWWVVARVEDRKLATYDEAMRKHMTLELFDSWVEYQLNSLFSVMTNGPKIGGNKS